MSERRQIYLPAVTVAVVAVVLQVAALMARPGSPGTGRGLPLAGIDYGELRRFAIPALEASFVRQQLGLGPDGSFPLPARTAAPSRKRAGIGASEPAPAPSPTPTPSPGATEVVRGAGKIEISMTVDRKTAAPGDLVTYTIVARNTGDKDVTTAFVTNTHTPRFTLACADSTGSVCPVPGDYDGSSTDPGDSHTYPAQSQRTATVRAHSSAMIRTVEVKIAQAVPPGTTLHNHAHVDVVGDGRSTETYRALDVVVR